MIAQILDSDSFISFTLVKNRFRLKLYLYALNINTPTYFQYLTEVQQNRYQNEISCNVIIYPLCITI